MNRKVHSGGQRTSKVTASDTIRVMGTNPAKRKIPSANPPIAEDFAHEVGMVALAWTHLENEFRALLESLEKAYPLPSSFKVKPGFAGLLQRWQYTTSNLFTTNASLLGHLKTLVQSMEAEQWRRNFLIHGKTECVLTATPFVNHLGIRSNRIHRTLEITGAKRIGGKRQSVTEKFTPESLDDMYHEIAHLTGKVRQLALESKPPLHVNATDWSAWRVVILQFPPVMQA